MTQNHPELEFSLPPENIAKHPVEPRDSCRLLVVHRSSGEIEHLRFRDLPRFLRPGDVLVVNESRVIRARLFGKVGERRTEVFLLSLQPESSGSWPCLVRPGKKISPEGSKIRFADGSEGTLYRKPDRGFRLDLPLETPEAAAEWLERNGEMPLPPYLHRSAESRDSTDYQTVYAATPGSVAAPTAGLHFTPELLDKLRQDGVEIAPLQLHVGYGTFAPLDPGAIESGKLHAETYSVPPATVEILDRARREGRRVFAVGTTSTRALESLDPIGPEGETQLFIRPGYQFLRVTGLITNFHLPGSSLLWLVGALLGTEQTQRCYQEAIDMGYRFYSFGDAMLIL